jgi:hypothetical protein
MDEVRKVIKPSHTFDVPQSQQAFAKETRCFMLLRAAGTWMRCAR